MLFLSSTELFVFGVLVKGQSLEDGIPCTSVAQALTAFGCDQCQKQGAHILPQNNICPACALHISLADLAQKHKQNKMVCLG